MAAIGTTTSLLDQVAWVYDEHERRRMAYAGRDLTVAERRDLALAGLGEVLRESGATVQDLEDAAEICDVSLRLGAPVGAALRTTFYVLREHAAEA